MHYAMLVCYYLFVRNANRIVVTTDVTVGVKISGEHVYAPFGWGVWPGALM